MVLLTFTANAQSEYEKESSTLGIDLSVSPACSFTQADLHERIEGEFYRARLKPAKNSKLDPTVDVLCVEVKNVSGVKTGHAISYEVRFRFNGDGLKLLMDEPNYGQLVISGPDADAPYFLMNHIRDDVSLALTFFLKNLQ